MAGILPQTWEDLVISKMQKRGAGTIFILRKGKLSIWGDNFLWRRWGTSMSFTCLYFANKVNQDLKYIKAHSKLAKNTSVNALTCFFQS